MQDSDGLSALFAINDKHAQHKKYLRSGITHLGWGVNLKDLEKEIDISIPDSERSGHFGCFGTTRIGKSKLMEYIIEQDIKKGYNVVVIDPKVTGAVLSGSSRVRTTPGVDDAQSDLPRLLDHA